jgi:ribonuclease HI
MLNAIQLKFPAANNISEYEGLIIDLQLANDLGTRRLLIRGDSQLVAKQVQNNCRSRVIVTLVSWEARRDWSATSWAALSSAKD